jgi:hypothetical protein
VTNKQHNKALHPTAYSFVPFARASLHFGLPAAGELNRSAAARLFFGRVTFL